MISIGLDAGSVSVKVVLLDEAGNKREGYYSRHKGHPLKTALELLEKAVGAASTACDKDFSLSVTGSSGRLIAAELGVGFTNELVAQTYATRKLFPHIRTIIELGGEDSKLILLGRNGIGDFSMNSVCAAGTGSFLDQQAERLRLSIEEFSELALRSKPSRIAGRCSVFAKSDMIHLQQIATPVEDIVAGLCFAVARNFRGAIVRGRTIEEPVSFHGGVAANQGMVRAFREIFGFSAVFVPADFALMGAIGAAMKNRDEGTIARFDLEKLRSYIESTRFSEYGYKPLVSEGDDFFERHPKDRDASSVAHNMSGGEPDRPSFITSHASPAQAYLGIDIGSISTNLAVIDEKGRLLAKRYLMTAGRPIDAVNQGLREIGEEVGERVEIRGVGTTGSGRYMIADYVGADIVKNEITAQATAAAFIDERVDTIFEIGGQDSKYISLRDGVIVDFEMNKACAAGTGSFLEEQAEKLNISVKGEFADCAFSSDSPCRLGERCTVFMENSLMANLQRGADRDDLLAGLAYSIVQNYITKVVAGKPVGEHIFFQGGVAFNKSVVAAFEKYLDKKMIVPPHHDVTGAIGMALIAMRHMGGASGPQASEHASEQCISPHPPFLTGFKGFELSRRSYEVSSFECKGCPNVCEINRVKIAGEEDVLFYGGRCEKYDVKKNRVPSALPDLFAFREEMLWKDYEERKANLSARSAGRFGKIGIPYIFFFHDYLPFWTTILRELGFDVEVSPRTNREIIATGAESVLADTCFPVKVAHGHIKHLIGKGIDTLLIPSFINMNTAEEEFERGYACPLTQTIPYAARVAHPEARIIAPVVNLRAGGLEKEIVRAFKPFGIKRGAVKKALEAAGKAQEAFSESLKAKGAELLPHVGGKTVVIIGRSYNAFDKGMNLNIPRKLSDLGVLALPMDFIPAMDLKIDDTWPNMYWKSGQKILKAARHIRQHPHLYALYIGNFSCGPDSFILKYFKEEMQGKPFLQIEIDEHSADAGAITRCEAFLDSIAHRKSGKNRSGKTEEAALSTARPFIGSERERRTVFVPYMASHAFAIAAAFERCGSSSEVLPESDKDAVDIGKRYVSGKECYPCTVTTGDMLKKALSPGFRPGNSAFFMPSGTGPCRFGQYNVLHRMILDELGYRDVPILSPNQDAHFYKDLGIVGKDFSAHAWRGVIAYELLEKCLHETRPYEKEKGAADVLYLDYLGRLYASLRGADGKTETVLANMRKDFEALARRAERKPVIGIVGEIFVRSHTFSNEDLARKVEALGGEVWRAPVEEWIYYVNLMAVRKALIKKDRSAMIEVLLKTFFQKRIEHRFSKYFEGFLRTLREPETKEILKKASPYLHDSFEGEAILSIGKSIDLIRRGASGIINAMPFGCMPGTVVTTLMHGLSRDFEIPCLSMPYDGTESPTLEIQLEAFMNQAAECSRRAVAE
ncbi:MAG: acyl-CoA dehydratase activase [Nitrospirae bacterium]|nr:acyl-CoA dehydratase activase [Nitrospirota bacterium]